MSWLAISGIDLSAVIAQGTEPKADRRDIGDITDANDGSKRATRTTRKYDFSGITVPLNPTDAFAWESLIVGAGDVWSFDASYYSSKGLPVTPSDPGDTSLQSVTKKFGANALKISLATQFVTASSLALTSVYTSAVWWKQNTAPWHHYVSRSDGAKWLDGVRNDATSDPFFGLNSTLVAATNADYFDDWVVCPYLWPTTWAPLVYANNAAFSPLPYLTCAGDLVPEAATRSMIGKASVANILVANPGAGRSKAMQKLQVDLLGA